MSVVADAGRVIASALETIPDLRVFVGIGQQITPPAAIVGPPKLTWSGYSQSGQPRTGIWSVYLTVPFNPAALDTLLGLIGTVTGAIENSTPAVVLSANPGVYPSLGGALPAYQIMVEMDLPS